MIFFADLAPGGFCLASNTNLVARKMALPGIQNAFQVASNIYSGSQPENETAFSALASLGIKTIVSVDGSKPDTELAHKHGLRYIHLPFGYDGIPTNRVIELSQVALTQPGPLYVHCHHGKHRGPAAVAVMCEAASGWSPDTAEAWLREVGTAADYPGLYRTVRAFKMPTPRELNQVKVLSEIAQSTSLVDTMVAIDGHCDQLKASQIAGWASSASHPDLSPAQAATLLWEQFRELSRLGDDRKLSSDYQRRIESTERLAYKFQTQLHHRANPTQLDETLKSLNQACADCHRSYRNK